MSLEFDVKDIALTCCFAPWYTILSFWSLFPIIGVTGKFITMATIAAPLMGIILGPWLGAMSIILGGVIGISIALTLSPISFSAGVATAVCSGLLYKRRCRLLSVLYAILLTTLMFYPRVGPAWLYPYFVWLQFIGLIVLISPLQRKASEFLSGHSKISHLTTGVAIITFTSTMFGHIVGTITFEALSWLMIISEPNSWESLWQLLTFVYPVERIIITLIATIIGTPLIKALKTYGFKMGGR